MLRSNVEGIVKFYDKVKGYGFIIEAKNQQDIFVHVTNLNCRPLEKGDSVRFNTKEGRRGESAIDVEIIKD